MSEENFRYRHVWTFNETKAFLAAYSARKSEFNHTRKKKFAMANLLQDLIRQNALSEDTTVETLQNKLKNLFRVYKAAQHNNSLPGNAPIKVPFHKELEEIFGEQKNISNVVKLGLRGQPSTPFEVMKSSQSSSSSVLPILCSLPQSASSPSLPSQHSPSPHTSTFRSSPASDSHSSPTPSIRSLSSQLSSTSKKCKSPRAEWYAEKIKNLKMKEKILQAHLEKMEKAKEERFTKFMEQRQREHDEKMKLLRQLINKKKLKKLLHQ